MRKGLNQPGSLSEFADDLGGDDRLGISLRTCASALWQWRLLGFPAWAESTCAACTTTGPAWTSTTPLHWAVPKDAFDQDVMDEGVWLIDTTNGGEATEAGYVSGWWPYSKPRT